MSCPLSSHWAAPTCTPDNTKGGGQAAGPLKRPTLPDTHQAPPRSPPPGSTRDRWSPAAGQASSQGEGRAPSPGPPSPLVRSRDDSYPSPHWMGRREASCPPGLPAGRQVSLQTPSPLPQPPEYICTQGLDCRREGPVQPGSGWGLGDLCSDSRPSWAGGPTPCLGDLSSSTLPSDRCRRETAVQRPAQLLLWGWPGSLSWDLFLLCVGWEALSASLSLTGSLGVPTLVPSEARSRLGVQGQTRPLGPTHVSGRGTGAAGGAFKYVPGPLPSGVGLTPRWSWCSDGGSSKPCSFCPAIPGPWRWRSPPPPGEDTAGTTGRGSGPTKSHVRELGGRPPSLVQPSLQRKSPGQNCDHSL